VWLWEWWKAITETTDKTDSYLHERGGEPRGSRGQTKGGAHLQKQKEKTNTLTIKRHVIIRVKYIYK
jgi:hypothetical protein